MELFGFTITRSNQNDTEEKLPSIVSPQQEDGSIEVAQGGVYGQYIDLEGKAKNEGQLVSKYREMSVQPECDLAVQDVINEAIIVTEESGPCHIVLDNTNLSKSIKNKINEEFKQLLNILDFNNSCYDIFKKWYVDGKLYYHIVIDDKNPRQGIKDLRYVDPRKIRKIREPIKSKDKRTGATLYKGENTYYMYNPKGFNSTNGNQGVRIAGDSIAFCHSGILDQRNNMVYSHLHKAIKPLNQLRMLEDAVVIYRLARAPERRIFYIDVGNLPKMKAEQYLRDMMVKHKNKLTYDAQTGEVKDDRKFMTMLEDFWLPRREGGRGTEITTLPGGQNLGEMEDVEYFKKKLYKALNVPISRMESEATFNLGRSTEITRDEIKFAKFIRRLRARFSMLFNDLLEVHLALKGVISRDEWKQLKKDIYYDYQEDNHFAEMKDAEINRERLQLLNDVDNFTEKYFSKAWVRKNVLRMNEDEIAQIEKEIKQETEEEDGFDDNQSNEPQQQEPEQEPEESVQANTENEPLTESEQKLVDRMSKYMGETTNDE